MDLKFFEEIMMTWARGQLLDPLGVYVIALLLMVLWTTFDRTRGARFSLCILYVTVVAVETNNFCSQFLEDIQGLLWYRGLASVLGILIILYHGYSYSFQGKKQNVGKSVKTSGKEVKRREKANVSFNSTMNEEDFTMSDLESDVENDDSSYDSTADTLSYSDSSFTDAGEIDNAEKEDLLTDRREFFADFDKENNEDFVSTSTVRDSSLSGKNLRGKIKAFSNPILKTETPTDFFKRKLHYR